MFRWLIRCLFVFSLLVGLCALPEQEAVAAQPSDAVVRAVLFYSPSCGHCHYVITEVLPPLYETYGNQLNIAGVDVTQPDGQALFMAALMTFGLESGGVPFLVIADKFSYHLIAGGRVLSLRPHVIYHREVLCALTTWRF